MSIVKFIEAVRLMPHYTNGGSRRHELEVGKLLEDNNFTRRDPKDTPFNGKNKSLYRDKLLSTKGIEGLQDNSYYPQPMGTQNSPDFVVTCNGRSYLIECKSSKKDYPVYNSGLPKQDYIYIFSSMKENKTVTFLGSDIVTKTFIKNLKKLTDAIDNSIKDFNSLMDSTNSPAGLGFYCRSMFNHYQYISKNTYFDPKVILKRNKKLNKFI